MPIKVQSQGKAMNQEINEINKEIFDRVKKIVVEELEVEPEAVKPESSFANDLGADSLDTVELVMALEEEFKIEIPDEVSEQIDTVGKAVKHIEASIKAPA